MERGEQSRQGEPWQPTKDFFLTDPRSASLREVCLGIVRRLDALLRDRKISESETKRSQIYAELEMQGGRLIELGIEPSMHIGRLEEEFKSSPVTAAEYVAGILFKSTGAQIVSETDTMATTQEMSEFSSDSAYVIKGENITPRLQNVGFTRVLVNRGYDFLGAQPEEKYQIEDNPQD